MSFVVRSLPCEVTVNFLASREAGLRHQDRSLWSSRID